MRGLQGEGQKQSITRELILLGLVFQNPTYKLVIVFGTKAINYSD